jgi:two-component system NtrC family sensor kinase
MEEHYRAFKRRNLFRLSLTYLSPLLVLIIYLYIQYDGLMQESNRLHLRAIAESQANTLDLFLEERRINLSNLIDDPRFKMPPSPETIQANLEKLKRASGAFVDIGYFDSTGVQIGYAGPYPSLEKRNYSSEPWYITLKHEPDEFIITDIYRGFRDQPHFTIAVSRFINGEFAVLRATLSPDRIHEYLSSLEGSQEVFSSIVNTDGYFQVVTEQLGTPLEQSNIIPPQNPLIGSDEHEGKPDQTTAAVGAGSNTYAYAWLRGVKWAVIVQSSSTTGGSIFSGFRLRIILTSAVVVLVIFLIINNRANKLVQWQKESDETRDQLEHAAKMASVGELAAGIAHEINNPLAVINEEAGLMKDLMNPEFEETETIEQLTGHLDTIQQSVFRCRDITRKLLGFVRRSAADLKPHDIHRLIDRVVDGLLGPELAVSNVEVIKRYGPDIPEITTDENQLQQVLLNIVNNGVDALEERPGQISLATACEKGKFLISITDTGKGIPPDELDKIFLPFFTTKEVGKGTGLGLSVSYGIIKGLGGKIEVESSVGQGSTFIISLPLK